MALQGKCGVSMTHIMEADSWASHSLYNRLEMDVQRLETDEHTVAGEDHVILVVPAASCTQALFALLALGFLEYSHSRGGQGDGALLAVFQRRIHHLALVRAGGDTDELPVYTQGVLFKIHTVPGQADQLALTQASEEVKPHHQVILIVLRKIHEHAHLLFGQRVHFMLLDMGQLTVFAHILANQVHLHGLVQHTVEHTMHISNTLGRQALFLQQDVHTLHHQRREAFQLHIADVRHHMQPEVALIVIEGRVLHLTGLEGLHPLPAPLLHSKVGFGDAGALGDLRPLLSQLVLHDGLCATIQRMLLAVHIIIASFPGSVGTLADIVLHFSHC